MTDLPKLKIGCSKLIEAIGCKCAYHDCGEICSGKARFCNFCRTLKAIITQHAKAHYDKGMDISAAAVVNITSYPIKIKDDDC